MRGCYGERDLCARHEYIGLPIENRRYGRLKICATKSKKGGPYGPPFNCARGGLLLADVFLLARFIGGVEGVLQRHEVFAGLEGVEQGLLGFQLLGGVVGG